jgi:glycosyltransferase involved in cell wall biosynthesis
MKNPSALARKVLKLFWLTLPAHKSAYITCISQATKEELLQHIHFPTERIKVIPTVVDESLFSFIPRNFNIERPVLLFIGTTPNKNLERVAKALNGIPCLLEIVGPISEVQKIALQENKIHFSNEVGINNARIAEKYQEADILLFPSTYEGFGMPILEAQLTGRPVITSNFSAMREVAGDSACLVNPFSVESIRQGVIKVIEEEDYREKLVKNGKENVKRFSAHKVAKMYLTLYQEMYAKNH